MMTASHAEKMLHEFLTSNREELISRCKMKAAKRSEPKSMDRELQYGISVFLAQLVKILRAQGPAWTLQHDSLFADLLDTVTGMSKTASKHGNELLLAGFSLNQVVHDYGDLCQTVTELAIETDEKITNIEFRTLNRCLDNAVASAISGYTRRRDQNRTDETGPHTMNGSVSLVEQQLNLIHQAIFALDAIKAGNVGITGATGDVLDRSLQRLLDLTARASGDAESRDCCV